MKVSELKYEDLTDEYVDKILFENIKDDGEPGGLYFSFWKYKS
ncbi:MAG: hypothetical protein RR448_06120 [Niameybacter sp.]